MMTESVDLLNRTTRAEVERVLLDCCGSRAWVSRMLAERPFADARALFDAADRAWRDLPREDRLEAFRAHPRIGERKDAAGQSAAWSEQEQSAAAGADARVRAELAAANAGYERRFGHIFIVCATGKSAKEMLALVLARMANDPDTEIEVASEEQRKITRLRLEKVVGRRG